MPGTPAGVVCRSLRCGAVPTHDDDLKPLILTDVRVLIADLFVGGPVGSAPIRLTADAIVKATGLDRRTVSMNMRSLPLTGWFRLDWEDGDPYDFTYVSLRRRIFLDTCARDALALCIKDFMVRRSSGRNAEVSTFSVEYVPPRVDHGEPVGEYVPVSTWELGGATVPTARATLLIHCLERPDAFHRVSEVSAALGVTKGTARRLLAGCENAGLMTSKLFPGNGCSPTRAFRLNEKGVAVARSVAERAGS